MSSVWLQLLLSDIQCIWQSLYLMNIFVSFIGFPKEHQTIDRYTKRLVDNHLILNSELVSKILKSKQNSLFKNLILQNTTTVLYNTAFNIVQFRFVCQKTHWIETNIFPYFAELILLLFKFRLIFQTKWTNIYWIFSNIIINEVVAGQQ